MKYKHTLLLLVMCSLLTSCTSLFYQPDRYLHYDASKLGVEFENIYTKSKDGTKLHGWYFHNKQNKEKPLGLIVHFHGNAENMSSHFLNLAWVLKHGYDLFVFDYRGYGTSEGRAEKDGIYEDSLALLRKSKELYLKNNAQKFVIVGQSLGGAISARALGDFHNTEDVDLLVLDSTFMSYQDVASQLLKKHWLTWIFSPLAYVLISDKYATNKIIPELNIPILVIHGKKDHIVAFENGEEIFKKISHQRKYFWELPNGRHTDVFARKDDHYRQELLDLLKKL